MVSCECTDGWSGSDCSEDLDSCEENPCYAGVQCIDQPPPEINATCGSCPPGLMGDGFKCYGKSVHVCPVRSGQVRSGQVRVHVQCIDQPPPTVNATCVSCPPGLMGDGFKCYGELI